MLMGMMLLCMTAPVFAAEVYTREVYSATPAGTSTTQTYVTSD